MSLSIYNSTTSPLNNGDIFEGQVYDNILDFAEINISINCDVGYTITYIYSQDKININYIDTEIIPASAITTFIKKSVYDRYFKLKIEATNGDMTIFNLQTIYKTNISFDENNAIGNNVNIVAQSAGLGLDTTLQTINAGQKTIGDLKIWNNASVLLNGVSSVAAAKGIYGSNFVSIFGNCDTTTTLIIELSNDNITFYKTQYSYSINTVGDFGFSLQIPFKYLRLINTGQNINSIIAYINFK